VATALRAVANCLVAKLLLAGRRQATAVVVRRSGSTGCTRMELCTVAKVSE
jgi:hypothetical protein